MTKETFESYIAKISSTIATLPEPQRSELAKVVDDTRQRFEAIQNSAEKARDALDDLRLYQKYLVFDAEAPAREAQTENNDPDDEASF